MTKRKIRILILDDDPRRDRGRAMYVRWIKSTFSHSLNAGYECEVLEASNADQFRMEVAQMSAHQHVDLAILDMKLSHWQQDSEGNLKEIEGSHEGVEQGSNVLEKFPGHPSIKRFVVLTGEQKSNPEAERIAQGAVEYWDKMDTTFETFRQQIVYWFTVNWTN